MSNLSELTQILLTAMITVLGGLFVLTTGQVLIKFFIEPIHELRKLVGEIAFSLVLFAGLYANPTTLGSPLDQERRAASDTLRQQASQLQAKAHAIPWYGLFEMLRFVPKREHVMQASANLIGLSNSLIVAARILDAVVDNNLKLSAEIKRILQPNI